MKLRIIVFILCSFVFFVAAALGQSLVGPNFITANSDGTFEYLVLMTYPASGAYFGGYTIYDTENIGSGTLWIDGFCITFIEGNTQTFFTVTGFLDDPDQNGVVTFEWFGCDPGFSETLATTVFGGVVADEDWDWGGVKALYR